MIDRGEAKLLGWVGDETPWQVAAAFTATATANNRRETVERFLRAYRKAVREYCEAFIAPDGTRRNGPGANGRDRLCPPRNIFPLVRRSHTCVRTVRPPISPTQSEPRIVPSSPSLAFKFVAMNRHRLTMAEFTQSVIAKTFASVKMLDHHILRQLVEGR